MSSETATHETRVPPDESPAECPYCQRPLESAELLTLHKGLDHWERLDDDERERFRETYAAESESLRSFRLKLLGLLVVLYFAFLFVYSYVTTDPISAGMVATARGPIVGAL
ncbi:DNA-binding protein [Halorussus marinus]|uniref:DNA-binding protein n=1 Tax=Halorussus marinus TaxID=2505976 RepID=UPI001FCED91A|nr:DNA-binding protein [Halorussus marinus]